MDSLQDIISDIRIFLYGGILTLPLTIAGTLSILGLFTANYAMLFFLVGYLVLTPLAAFGLNTALDAIFSGTSRNPFKARWGDICKVVIPFSQLPIASANTVTNSKGTGTDATIISSSWVAMVAFFTGYIFTNGLELYNREAPANTLTVTSTSASDLDKKVTNRRTQAIIAMVSTLVFALVVLGFRYYSGCESMLGMILTTAAFIWAGRGWYKVLSAVGEDRLSDLFGIACRLLPPSAINNAPIACVPVPN
jgi:hypothetical protein